MAYLRPGVYVEESLNLIPPIQSPSSQSIGAFLGTSSKGPTEATLVTSWTQYTSLYGSWGTDNTLALGVYLFFANGGNSAYIKRVTGTGAAAAERTFDDRSVGTDPTLTLTAKNPGEWGNSIYVSIANASVADSVDITIYSGGTTSAYIVEQYTDLNMTPSSARYAVTFVNGQSKYVVASDEGSAATGGTRNPSVVSVQPLAGGTAGGAVTESDIANAAPAFDTIDNALVLNAPGVTASAAVNVLISYAEGRDDVFVVVDGINDTVANQLTRAASYTASSLAAVYYPPLVVPNPTSAAVGATVTVGAGGAIVGQFMATDATRGVFKAPAGLNNRISGAVAVNKLTNSELDSLNSASAAVNALKFVPGSGIVVMGSRTLKAGYVDKYVPVRRSLIYLRKALTDLTAFAVFEPNDAALWRRITATTETFLSDFWRKGGLRGATPQEAFFVKCDGETNPLIKVDNGEVNIEVGVALQRPAEFVIIKIGQYDGGTTVTVA